MIDTLVQSCQSVKEVENFQKNVIVSLGPKHSLYAF